MVSPHRSPKRYLSRCVRDSAVRCGRKSQMLVKGGGWGQFSLGFSGLQGGNHTWGTLRIPQQLLSSV